MSQVTDFLSVNAATIAVVMAFSVRISTALKPMAARLVMTRPEATKAMPLKVWLTPINLDRSASGERSCTRVVTGTTKKPVPAEMTKRALSTSGKLSDLTPVPRYQIQSDGPEMTKRVRNGAFSFAFCQSTALTSAAPATAPRLVTVRSTATELGGKPIDCCTYTGKSVVVMAP